MHRPTTKQQELIDLLVGYGETIALNVNVMLGAVSEGQRHRPEVLRLQTALNDWSRVAFTSRGKNNLFKLRRETSSFSEALKKNRSQVLLYGDLPNEWKADLNYELRFFRKALREALEQGKDVFSSVPYGIEKVGQQDYIWIFRWSPRPEDGVDWRLGRSIEAPKKYEPTCVYCRGDGEATNFHCPTCGHQMVAYNFDKVACPVCLMEERDEQIMESSIPTTCPACQGSGKQPIRYELDFDIFAPELRLPHWFYDNLFGWVILNRLDYQFVIRTRYPNGLQDCWYARYFADLPPEKYPIVPNLTIEEA